MNSPPITPLGPSLARAARVVPSSRHCRSALPLPSHIRETASRPRPQTSLHDADNGSVVGAPDEARMSLRVAQEPVHDHGRSRHPNVQAVCADAVQQEFPAAVGTLLYHVQTDKKAL